ncbi:MAG: peptide chain release factor 3 [Deltaproteobacteria bacterium CG2_30_63_29]|nr:MAG: peptide chain release factor 3 [Deltaproteobacteria bacterium CG2_30_63_29]PIW00334.1 MAG: peptide chain release factor 3 [Deltaproteobacteria bacterium CG17_big_fil_post_rev_8_21_14_2_50_63_7]PJB39352.1 MAG: peptide chain release factor 3 [Deltaproteobacteria bacterium CG_4_9_14_3_um_filter_63_12]
MSIETKLAEEIARRRTFAIISHPDAGKTTLTEKLLLYGGALRMAGSVKSRKTDRHAASDWMAMEQERGISISTSVMQFEFDGCHMNLLDTPGHNDFSEDTYRTLAAADCAIMLIDSVKGVEPQTIKLFEVCKMRGVPIVTFINKMDRLGREPLDLLNDIEQVLQIPTSPVSWPIGAGKSFQGVYDRWHSRLLRFERADGGATRAPMIECALDDPALVSSLGRGAHDELMEALELLDGAGDTFDRAAFLAGELTPVFFGSALSNFGVEPFLNEFVHLAPPPRPREVTAGVLRPTPSEFSGFVFKIQANMDLRHRDRIAFVRVCSGQFDRGMQVKHMRLDKNITLAKSLQFMAQERMVVDTAVAGDILGLWDSGQLRIGDTLCIGEDVEYQGIPRFSPEHFVRVVLNDVLKRKQLKKGLEQLSEEGAVQVFYDRERLERDPILGAVGMLQFDVVKHRLDSEYNVSVDFERLPFQFARWVEGEDFDPGEFERRSGTTCLLDVEQRPILLFSSEWMMRRLEEQYDKLRFIAAVQPGRIQK